MDDDEIKKDLAQGDMIVRIGGFVFILVGLGIMYGGYVLWDEEPNAWIMFPFGGAFAVAGIVVQRVFVMPKGKKRVVVATSSHSTSRRSHRSVSSILVDENADESEIEAAKERWAANKLAHRDDWAEGRIKSNFDNDPGPRWKGAAAAGMLAIILAVSGFIWDEIFIAFAWILAAIAGVVGYLAWWAGRHRQKYGDSWLVPDALPLHLGARFDARIETGISPDATIPEAATQTLTCTRTWEERYRDSDGKSSTRTRSERLWEDVRRRDPVRRGDPEIVVIPVSFEIPEGLPPSTPGSRTGITWGLKVRIDFKGLDYQSAFALPVFEEGSLLSDALADAHEDAQLTTEPDSTERPER
ncbi:MAG: hypothetical protein AAGC81_13260 [Pseudomonadota bacterium]